MASLRGINGALLPYSEAQQIYRVAPLQYPTVQAAINAADPGSVIEITPGAYLEAVTITKALALVCKGAPGSCAIMGITVLADDVSLWNVGAFGATAEAAFALKVGSQTVSPDRFRVFGGKYENAVTAIILKGAGDVLLDGCEFAWAGTGLAFDDNDDGFCTQIFVQNCRFHNLATAGVGLVESGGVVNLHLLDNVFDNDEGGTPPTDYIKVDRSGDTGIVAGNRFACATHASATITIAAGILYVGNYTEEGVNATRPD